MTIDVKKQGESVTRDPVTDDTCADFSILDKDFILTSYSYGVRSWYNATYADEIEAAEVASNMKNNMQNLQVGAWFINKDSEVTQNSNVVGLKAKSGILYYD